MENYIIQQLSCPWPASLIYDREQVRFFTKIKTEQFIRRNVARHKLKTTYIVAIFSKYSYKSYKFPVGWSFFFFPTLHGCVIRRGSTEKLVEALLLKLARIINSAANAPAHNAHTQYTHVHYSVPVPDGCFSPHGTRVKDESLGVKHLAV